MGAGSDGDKTGRNVYIHGVRSAAMLRIDKERQTEIRGCYAADQCAFVLGAVHIIALSPTLSSEPVIGVPSAFDTNIYTTHKQTPTHVGMLPNTTIPFNPHPLCLRKSCRAFGSSRKAKKTSLRERRRGM